MDEKQAQMLRAVALTGKGLALCDFAFRDGPQLGLSDSEAYAIATRLIDSWDGSETLLQMYKRTEHWPNELNVPAN